MEKKLYVKPGMRVKPIRISGLICGSGDGRSVRSMSTNLDPADIIGISDEEETPTNFMGR